MQELLNFLGPSALMIGFLALIIGIFVISIFVSYRRSQATREVWETVSMRAGLTLQPGNLLVRPSLSGEYRRRTLVMNTFTRGTSRHRKTYTRITLAVSNPGGSRLTLSPEGFLSGLGRTLGMQDVPIGSERFDKSFMVKSEPPEFAPSLLGDPMLQDSLLQVRDRSAFELSLDGAGLTFTTRGVLRDGDYIVSIYNAMSDLADRVEGGTHRSAF